MTFFAGYDANIFNQPFKTEPTEDEGVPAEFINAVSRAVRGCFHALFHTRCPMHTACDVHVCSSTAKPRVQWKLRPTNNPPSGLSSI